ncbi:S8 family peptidase [Lewinella sp. IMCC34191]|uniref:S8 family peptidase n=1 Tax=Lewinella sp. IMCC34191 TaxID=2259172 RepID=UPI000E21E539|nr:S8 family serine peptidase [Lewinella sp. IMCC34191]
MQRILLFASFISFVLTGCQKEIVEVTADRTDPLTRTELNARVERQLRETNKVFEWSDAEDLVVWSALTLSDHQAVLGYQPAGFDDIEGRIHEIDVTTGAWKQTRDALVADLRAATERLTGTAPRDEDLFVAEEDGILPILEVRILHPEVLTEFRGRPEVRYLEPSNYTAEEVQFRSDSGCSGAPAADVDAEDYGTTASGAKVAWNYGPMGIPEAWTRTQGDNIGICIIDSGTYPEQDRLNGNFGSGRELTRLGVYQPSWWSSRTDGPDDQCGHGTQMAGLATAPLTTTGSSVGVAYRSDLLAIRATSDVIINASKEKRGVKDALVIAGQDAGTQIVSMSIGDVFSSGTVKDGIYYAHNRGKMILAAAGTSLSWTSWYGVIFPANISQTVAVTGIQTGTPYLRCNTCHDGSEVDFVAVMQRREDTGRSTITLSRSGATPGYVGGSSAATATTAGIAALVWATNPGQTREQVLQRMKEASSLYPNRSGNFGWGTVNADLATR